MEVVYCDEQNISQIIAEIGQKAEKEKLKINVIPQFVGAKPVVYTFGPINNSMIYHTIILKPKN